MMILSLQRYIFNNTLLSIAIDFSSCRFFVSTPKIFFLLQIPSTPHNGFLTSTALIRMSNEKFESVYNRLNTTQKQAVDTIYGPVMVIVGP